MKPYLALFRAGPSSLHPQAVERLDAQNFDYALSWFGDESPAAPGAQFVHLQKGAKWPGLLQTLVAHWALVSQYRYVWLPDDDLLCVPEQVSRMFSICDDLHLDLAQPALTAESYFSHVVTLRHSAFQLRFTNFVEVMAPVFSREMLAKALPTMEGQVSGWGLDSVWPNLTRLGRVAIIDDTPVTHTRPVGGPNYALSQKAGISPLHESWIVAAGHFIEKPMDQVLTMGGLLQSGDALCLSDQTTDIEAMLQALVSCAGLRLSTTQLTRYLAQHLDFARSGGSWQTGYARGAIRIALERALSGVGLKFNLPGRAAIPATAAPAATPAEPVRVAAETPEPSRQAAAAHEQCMADLQDLQERYREVLADRQKQHELLVGLAQRLDRAGRICSELSSAERGATLSANPLAEPAGNAIPIRREPVAAVPRPPLLAEAAARA